MAPTLGMLCCTYLQVRTAIATFIPVANNSEFMQRPPAEASLSQTDSPPDQVTVSVQPFASCLAHQPSNQSNSELLLMASSFELLLMASSCMNSSAHHSGLRLLLTHLLRNPSRVRCCRL